MHQKSNLGGAWLAHSKEHMTLDFTIMMSSSSTLGVEINKLKKKKRGRG